MDGVFDMDNSMIETDLSRVKSENIWVKMTIGSFRTKDVAAIYEDLGFRVKPLLIIRDVRYSFASLIGKEYGVNGNTAEDPPIRMRYRRFLDDWEEFMDNNWPILSFEKFVRNPEHELRAVLTQLGLSWNDAMMQWPKQASDISYLSEGNRTFLGSISTANCLKDALLVGKSKVAEYPVPEQDLEWLEDLFAHYNTVNGYPLKKNEIKKNGGELGKPDFERTSRKKLYYRIYELETRLQKIRDHVVIGKFIRFWSSHVNKDFNVF